MRLLTWIFRALLHVLACREGRVSRNCLIARLTPRVSVVVSAVGTVGSPRVVSLDDEPQVNLARQLFGSALLEQDTPAPPPVVTPWFIINPHTPMRVVWDVLGARPLFH